MQFIKVLYNFTGHLFARLSVHWIVRLQDFLKTAQFI